MQRDVAAVFIKGFKQVWKRTVYFKSVKNVFVISLLGNKLTLETRPSQDGIGVREELLKFHSTYYSSNLMGLCVLGRGKTL